MATTAAKAVETTAVVTVTLSLNRETKNTFRFDSADDDAAIPSLYIRKSAFKGAAPEAITVTVG